ncbi:MAG: helix-turn-helix transcriptional regulator [Caldilineaceae bacterium]|nr:helix-turn-helix transcriptional regulator [Caldilineaceae bacterium]
MMLSLLQTKFLVPSPRSRSGRFSPISRPRLLEKLNSGFGKKLTLICAPPGFGKSTLLSEWSEQCRTLGVEVQRGTLTPCAVAWLTLDSGDNDAVRFWSYFVAALQTLDANIGKSTLALLQSPQPLQAEFLLTSLLNDLAERSDLLLLILDDYHLITSPAIHQALTFLLDHLPPQLHLVLSARADPPLMLARWRGQGQLTELRTEDLRLAANEAALFLQEVMGLELSPTAVAALESRTEGWIAGLQLAALSLQGTADREKFIARFSGNNRYIVDYLVEEVLSQQPAEINSFLLHTSILEQLSGPLCDAVMGAAGGRGDAATSSQVLLEKLEQANLFLMPLDDERTWFRYHHLFADVLRHRLRKDHPNTIPDLHRRASRWYEEAGQIEAAVSHALAVPEVARAAALVESVALTILLHHSQVYVVRRLIEQIPLAAIHARPRLILAYGITLALFGQFEAVDNLLSQASATLNSQALSDEVEGGVAVLRSAIARFRGEMAQSLALAEQALEKLPANEYVLRAAAVMNVGVAHLRRGDSSEGEQLLAEAISLSVAGQAAYIALAAFEELATHQARQGQLTKAKETCEEALAQAMRWGVRVIPGVGITHIVAGEVLCEWNDLDGAIHELTEGLQLIQGTTEMNLLTRGYAALARAQRASGDANAAFLTLRQGDERLHQMQIAPTSTIEARARLALQRAQLNIYQGELAAALRWTATAHLSGETLLGCAQRHTLVRLRLAQQPRDPQPALLEEARQLLAQVYTTAEANGWMGCIIENQLLRALVCHALRERDPAQDALMRALTLGEPEGYIRTFVDEGEPVRLLLLESKLWLARKTLDTQHKLSAYVDRLLIAFGPVQAAAEAPPSPTRPANQHLVEPLTEREIEILRLVDSGLSNTEIASKLIVTVGTVKKHLNNIFGKLGVSSRTQALVYGRALDILQSPSQFPTHFPPQ